MKAKYSILLSITVHLIIIFILLLYFPIKQNKEKDEIKINVNLIVQKEENIIKGPEVIKTNADIIEEKSIIENSIDKPKTSNFITDDYYIKPDLVVKNTNISTNDTMKLTGIDINDFQESLKNLQPEMEFFEEEAIEINDDITIQWEGLKREKISNSYIDFSSFPKNSFTGVGVKVKFSVNPNGEVYEVSVIPPGSGSTEFDILIEQYISKFVFNDSNEKSSGEIVIVYKK